MFLPTQAALEGTVAARCPRKRSVECGYLWMSHTTRTKVGQDKSNSKALILSNRLMVSQLI